MSEKNEKPEAADEPAPLEVYQPKPAAYAIETASTSAAAQAKALVSARYEIAMARPRDEEVSRQRLLRDCKRPSFARAARYRKPVGKGIVGPSIRLAEAAIRAWGNVFVDSMVTHDDPEKRLIRVSVTDLEANVSYWQDVAVEKTVERSALRQGETPLRSRMNSQGKITYIYPATDDDLLNKAAALVSKAIRNSGLRVVPQWLVDDAVLECERTLTDQDRKDPAAARRVVFDAFDELGISVSDLQAYLGHDGGTLTPAELDDLRAVWATLRDGEATWAEVLEHREAERGPKDDKPAKAKNGGSSKSLKDALKGPAASGGGAPTAAGPTEKPGS